jgi:hypothetical protein
MRQRCAVPWWLARCEPNFPHLHGCSSTGPGPIHAAGVPFCRYRRQQPATERTQGKLNRFATAGTRHAGGSKLRGLRRSVSATTGGLRHGGRRIPDGGSQGPRLDRRVPCRGRCFRSLQSIPPIALAFGMDWVRISTMPVREFLGVDPSLMVVLSTALIGFAVLGVAILWNR